MLGIDFVLLNWRLLMACGSAEQRTKTGYNPGSALMSCRVSVAAQPPACTAKYRGNVVAMTMDFARYHRQMLLPAFSEDGQARLQNASVLILGCGALGSVVADMLARAGEPGGAHLHEVAAGEWGS